MHMDSLKQYHDKLLQGWSIPGDCHSVAIQTNVTMYLAARRTCFVFEKGEASMLTGCQYCCSAKCAYTGSCKCALCAGWKNTSQVMPSSVAERFRDLEEEDLQVSHGGWEAEIGIAVSYTKRQSYQSDWSPGHEEDEGMGDDKRNYVRESA